MSRTPHLLCLVLALCTVALGQGAGGAEKGKAGKSATDAAKKSLLSGAGYVQKDFLKGLREELGAEFGKQKGESLFEGLKKRDLSSDQTLDLMNGKTTTSALEDMFGTGKGDTERVDKAVKKCVAKKDKKLFFGLLLFLMMTEFGLDGSSDLCEQAAGAREEISDDSFKKLKRGNCSNKTIEEAFGLEKKSDCEMMQEILKMLMSSSMLCHPMCQSLGMAGGKKFDPSKCPPCEEGMPGSEEEFACGEAEGFPFDKEMPPCPFAGENAEEIFPPGEEHAAN